MTLSARTNCLFFAFALWWRRGAIGYVSMRKSRWGRFPHFLYQERGHFVSYVPADPKQKTCPPPIFTGRVRWGDTPISPPQGTPWHKP